MLSFADAQLGHGTGRQFADAFLAFDRTGFFETPMLYGAGNWSPKALHELDYSRVGALRISNPGSSSAEITMSVKLDGSSAEEVFSRFIRATSHSNPIGDFRKYPEAYAPILLGPRYFLFHGDGHCIELSNLLASLLRRILQMDVTVRYVVTDTRSFMHAFVERCDGPERMVLDPDQKSMADWNDERLPPGMVFQLMALGGARLYGSLSEPDRGWLFAKSTRDGLAEFFVEAAQPRIYRPWPTPKEISVLFVEARAHHIESVSLDVDDYEWKAPFRRALGHEALLTRANQPIRLMLPPGATITFGLDAEVLPKEVDLFPLIFFGRVPAVVRAIIPENGRLELVIPERPWLCCASRHFETMTINGRELRTHPSDEFAILGAGDLEDCVDEPGIDGTADFVIDGTPGESISVVLPFNALAFNSNVLEFAGELPAWVSGRMSL